ncbi:MAG: RnfABCDGE type electron transport complex subunit G, partial [Verrucomicrobiota bacterium]
MKETLKLTIALGIICAAAALVLAFAQKATAPAQQAAQERQQRESLKLVLPEFDNNPLEEPTEIDLENAPSVTFYPATKNGELVGIAAEGNTEKGYGGTMTILAGLKPDGTIRAVVVTDHSETPGLGTQATDRKRTAHISEAFTGNSKNEQENTLPPSEYLDQYTNKTTAQPDNFALKSDGGTIDAVSGATVSS